MDEKKKTIDNNNLGVLWTRFWSLIRLLVGDVRVNTDGTLQKQIDDLKDNQGTSDASTLQGHGADYFATKEELTELPMTAVSSGSTEEETNSFYDNYSAEMEENTSYRVAVTHSYAHSIFNGGRLYLEGFKMSATHEWQKLTRYNSPTTEWRRSKLNGIWAPWKQVDIGNVLTANKNVYVSPSGDDSTGDGSQSKPWKTIQKAVDECPSVSNGSAQYNICLADGEYNDNTINISNKTYIVLQSVSSNPNIVINTSSISVMRASIYISTPLTINSTSTTMSANTDSHVIIAKPIIVNSNGIGFQTSYNGKISFSTYSKGTVINKATYGLYSASMGEIYLFDANTVTFGSNVTTKYSTIGGGRIFTGTQGWQPIGSVTGNHEMAVDTNLYTEFLVVQNYNNTKHRYLISANEISGDPFSCRDGSYMHSTAYTGASITVYPYAKIIKNGISYVNGTDVLANTTMTIYGRRA